MYLFAFIYKFVWCFMLYINHVPLYTTWLSIVVEGNLEKPMDVHRFIHMSDQGLFRNDMFLFVIVTFTMIIYPKQGITHQQLYNCICGPSWLCQFAQINDTGAAHP